MSALIPTPARKEEHVSIRYTNMRACPACPLNLNALQAPGEPSIYGRMRACLNGWSHDFLPDPEILDKRRETVEHPFGSIKQWMNQGAFLMRRLANVNAEFSVTALAYNLRRAINILGVPALLRAVRA